MTCQNAIILGIHALPTDTVQLRLLDILGISIAMKKIIGLLFLSHNHNLMFPDETLDLSKYWPNIKKANKPFLNLIIQFFSLTSGQLFRLL